MRDLNVPSEEACRLPSKVQAAVAGAGLGCAARLGCRQACMAAAQVRRDLVEHRARSAVRKQRLQVCLREVADADVANKPPAMHKKRQRLGSTTELGLATG